MFKLERLFVAAIAATLLLGVANANACNLGFCQPAYVDPLAFVRSVALVYQQPQVVERVRTVYVEAPAPQVVQAPRALPAEKLTDEEAAQVLADATAAKNAQHAAAQPAPARVYSEPMVDPLVNDPAPVYQPQIVQSYYTAPAYYAPALAYGGPSLYAASFGGGFSSRSVNTFSAGPCGIGGCNPAFVNRNVQINRNAVIRQPRVRQRSLSIQRTVIR